MTSYKGYKIKKIKMPKPKKRKVYIAEGRYSTPEEQRSQAREQRSEVRKAKFGAFASKTKKMVKARYQQEKAKAHIIAEIKSEGRYRARVEGARAQAERQVAEAKKAPKKKKGIKMSALFQSGGGSKMQTQQDYFSVDAGLSSKPPKSHDYLISGGTMAGSGKVRSDDSILGTGMMGSGKMGMHDYMLTGESPRGRTTKRKKRKKTTTRRRRKK